MSELHFQLKPCPFCGGEARLRDDGDFFMVVCQNCWAAGQFWKGGEREQMIVKSVYAWNNRPGEEALAKFEAAYNQMRDAAEFLWTVVANAGEGNWAHESQDWQDAAAKARDGYHTALKEQGKLYVPAEKILDAIAKKFQDLRLEYANLKGKDLLGE